MFLCVLFLTTIHVNAGKDKIDKLDTSQEYFQYTIREDERARIARSRTFFRSALITTTITPFVIGCTFRFVYMSMEKRS